MQAFRSHNEKALNEFRNLPETKKNFASASPAGSSAQPSFSRSLTEPLLPRKKTGFIVKTAFFILGALCGTGFNASFPDINKLWHHKLQPIFSPSEYVAERRALIRSGPGMKFPIVDHLKPGEVSTVSSELPNWKQLSHGRYVHASMLSDLPKVYPWSQFTRLTSLKRGVQVLEAPHVAAKLLYQHRTDERELLVRKISSTWWQVKSSGYVKDDDLRLALGLAEEMLTRQSQVPVYRHPDITTTIVRKLPAASRVVVTAKTSGWAKLSPGAYVQLKELRKLMHPSSGGRQATR